MLLKEYIQYWFDTYRKPQQAPATAEKSYTYVKYHIIETSLGEMEMADIRTKDIQTLLNDLKDHGNCLKLKYNRHNGVGLAPATLKKIRQALCSAFRYAMIDGLVTRNYAEETQPIRSKTVRKTRPFTYEQKIEFLRIVKSHRFFIAYLLLFSTGMRRSEALGLSWDNIDLEKRTIEVCQTLIMFRNRPYLRRDTKNESSARVIPIPEQLIPYLKLLHSRQKNESLTHANYHNPNNLLFTNRDGSCINPIQFSRNFKNVITRHGFPSELHIHSIRHTWVTDMLQQNVPIIDIQNLGGWSRPDTLLRVYAHTVKKTQITAINKLCASFINNI